MAVIAEVIKSHFGFGLTFPRLDETRVSSLKIFCQGYADLVPAADAIPDDDASIHSWWFIVKWAESHSNEVIDEGISVMSQFANEEDFIALLATEDFHYPVLDIGVRNRMPWITRKRMCIGDWFYSIDIVDTVEIADLFHASKMMIDLLVDMGIVRTFDGATWRDRQARFSESVAFRNNVMKLGGWREDTWPSTWSFPRQIQYQYP